MDAEENIQAEVSFLAVSLGAKQALPELSTWPEAKKELQVHAVFPLVCDYMVNAGISDLEKLELTKALAVNIRSFHRLMTAQTALLELLDVQHIPAAVLKGAAAAQYYAKPELRQFGDIDVLVPPEDFNRAFELLKQNGYQNHDELNSAYPRHIGFDSPSGIEIELHRFFSSSRNKRQNTILDQWLYEGLRHVQSVNVGGYAVSVLPTLENGLVLLDHLNHHLCDGLGFRQIVDWMQYVRTELDDAFWENSFREKAEAIGLKTLAVTVTKMCRMYLGLDTEITWCDDADEELVAELLRYVSQCGNFGLKRDRGLQKTKGAIRRYLTNPIQCCRNLSDMGMQNMQKAGKKPRRAYAWIYQIGHLFWMRFVVFPKIRLSDVAKERAKEDDFLTKLGVNKF